MSAIYQKLKVNDKSHQIKVGPDFVFKPLPRSFFEDTSPNVARNILGKVLVRRHEGVLLCGAIVEVEAYLSENDPAAHNYIGKTLRNSVLFGEAGHAYVHSMRQYHLIDIVTEGRDIPGSVLIRALEPMYGIEKMKQIRKSGDILKLTSGPGRLCQALSIDRSLNGHDVTDETSSLFIADAGLRFSQESIRVSPRVGISKAADSMLRFYLKASPYVSAPRKG